MSRETEVRGGLHDLEARIPLVIESSPDIAAAWDIAEGVVDHLLDHAAKRDDHESAARRAAAAFQRAKGESHEADTAEHKLGQAVGAAMVLVLVHRGMKVGDWASMVPPELAGGGGGILASAGETVMGLLGMEADFDESGDQSSIGGGIADAAGVAIKGASILMDMVE